MTAVLLTPFIADRFVYLMSALTFMADNCPVTGEIIKFN